MLQENLTDAGEIIQNILTQPLSVPGGKANLSLLEAAKSFNTQDALVSDLRKILLNFLQFPEATNRMLLELERLIDTLN